MPSPELVLHGLGFSGLQARRETQAFRLRRLLVVFWCFCFEPAFAEFLLARVVWAELLALFLSDPSIVPTLHTHPP